MSKRTKLLAQIRANPRAVRFADLQTLLQHAGFTLVRISGSHHIYRHGSGRLCNIQKTGDGSAKPYQVKQVLEAVDVAG